MTVEWKKTDESEHGDKGTFLFYFDQGGLVVLNCHSDGERPYAHQSNNYLLCFQEGILIQKLRDRPDYAYASTQLYEQKKIKGYPKQ